MELGAPSPLLVLTVRVLLVVWNVLLVITERGERGADDESGDERALPSSSAAPSSAAPPGTERRRPSLCEVSSSVRRGGERG